MLRPRIVKSCCAVFPVLDTLSWWVTDESFVSLTHHRPRICTHLAEKNGWPADANELIQHDGFRAHVQQGVDAANQELARYEQIKKFTLLPEDFSLEGGVTPTQKVSAKPWPANMSRDRGVLQRGVDQN